MVTVPQLTEALHKLQVTHVLVLDEGRVCERHVSWLIIELHNTLESLAPRAERKLIVSDPNHHDSES
jgi:hypothetical protein